MSKVQHIQYHRLDRHFDCDSLAKKSEMVKNRIYTLIKAMGEDGPAIHELQVNGIMHRVSWFLQSMITSRITRYPLP